MGQYLTPGETARHLNVAPSTLRKWHERGQLDSLRVSHTPGGHRRYLRADVERMEQTGMPAPEAAAPGSLGVVTLKRVPGRQNCILREVGQRASRGESHMLSVQWSDSSRQLGSVWWDVPLLGARRPYVWDRFRLTEDSRQRLMQLWLALGLDGDPVDERGEICVHELWLALQPALEREHHLAAEVRVDADGRLVAQPVPALA